MAHETRPPDADSQLAERLVRCEPAAVAEFHQRFAAGLEGAFGEMGQELAEDYPPGCGAPLPLLLPHVGNRAGAGYVRRADLPLAAHVANLELPDLFRVSACLRHDGAAHQHLLDLVERHVKPWVLCRFEQLGRGRVEKVVADVVSHRGGPGRGSEESATPATGESSPAAQWLASYLGLVTLRRWLLGIVGKTLIDEVRDRVRRPQAPSVVAGEPPDERALEPAGGRPGVQPSPALEGFLAELTAALNDGLRQLKTEHAPRYQIAFLWLACGMQPADIAEGLGISHSTVSQHVEAIREHLFAAAEPVCRKISSASGVPLATIRQRLVGDREQQLPSSLEPFFENLLFVRLKHAYGELRTTRPDLLQVAFLSWCRQRDARAIADQLAESRVRVERLLGELQDWCQGQQTKITRQLSEEYDVRPDLLGPQVRRVMVDWFAGRQPAGTESARSDRSSRLTRSGEDGRAA